MEAFENPENTTPKSKALANKTSLFETKKVPVIIGVALPTFFEKVIRRNRKKTIPQTFRRPAYLKYIEYL